MIWFYIAFLVVCAFGAGFNWRNEDKSLRNTLLMIGGAALVVIFTILKPK